MEEKEKGKKIGSFYKRKFELSGGKIFETISIIIAILLFLGGIALHQQANGYDSEISAYILYYCFGAAAVQLIIGFVVGQFLKVQELKLILMEAMAQNSLNNQIAIEKERGIKKED